MLRSSLHFRSAKPFAVLQSAPPWKFGELSHDHASDFLIARRIVGIIEGYHERVFAPENPLDFVLVITNNTEKPIARR
ncbi:MAG: hypothetical protein KW788_01015 [Candidatus Doudnabacteria bacterium]|nr:hypothetical protein [Candidatus Doudnabacteria bacterium]